MITTERMYSMKNKLINVLLLFLFLTPISVSASTYTGKITTIRYSITSTPARLSIYVGKHGSPCGTGDWFAIENKDTVLISTLTAGFLNAQNLNKTVTINGTGVCDEYTVEGIYDVDFKK